MINSVTPAASFLVVAVATSITLFLVVPMALGLVRAFGLYAIVLERQCKVYVLFGSKAEIVLVPRDRTLLGDLIASQITPLSGQS